MRSTYQINSTISCYYQSDDPTNLKLHLDDVSAWFYCSFIPVILIGLLLSTWATLDLVRCGRRTHAYCRSEKTRKNHIKRQKEKDVETTTEKEVNVEENKSAEIVKSETIVSEVTEVTVQ